MQGDAGLGCGGPGGVAPWLARGPPKAGLAAILYKSDIANTLSID